MENDKNPFRSGQSIRKRAYEIVLAVVILLATADKGQSATAEPSATKSATPTYYDDADSDADTPQWSPRTRAEEWIVQQMECNCSADMSVFPDKRDRIVKASFLHEILTQSTAEYDEPRKSLFLMNATIEDDLFVQEADIGIAVAFEKCRMRRVDFLGAIFRKGLTLRECYIERFIAPEEINGDLVINDSTIGEELQAFDRRINGNIYGSGLTVLGPLSDVVLSGVVSKRCDFRDSRFQGSVAFSNLRVGGSMDLGGSKFQSGTQAQFDSMTVHDDLDISGAHFLGPVTFARSHVGGNFEAVGALFAFESMPKYLQRATPTRPPLESAGTEETYFDSVLATDLQVSGYAALTGAAFNGAADFTGMNVGRYLEASNAHFNSTSEIVSFSKCKFGGDISFDGSVFAGGINIIDTDVAKTLYLDEAIANGPVTLSDSRIDGFVSCDRVQFSADATFSASSANVVGGLSIRASVLRGAVYLRYFETKGDVTLDDTWFMSNAEMDIFEGKFGRNVSACRAHFAGYVNAFHVTVTGSMDLTGAWVDSPDGIFGETADIKTKLILSEITSAGSIDFAAATVGSLFFRNVTILNSQSTALFSDVTVAHLGVFARVTGQLSLQDSRLGELSFEKVSEPREGNAFNLMGTKYGLLVVNSSDHTEEFLNLLNNCVFHVSTYATLEQYLKATGRSSDADDIFIAGRRAALRQSALLPRLVWGVLDLATGYGRHMERLIWWLMGFVVFGTWVFWDKEGMRPKDEKHPYAYNPFWYSLGLFLPFDNLGISREWMPLEERWFARNYVHFQQIAGWLLVSIGIGALLGVR